jgi:hypothetical protein
LKTIVISGEMESNDDEGKDSKPLSMYIPKILGKVQEKAKEWKECKLLAILGRFLQMHSSGKVSSSS